MKTKFNTLRWLAAVMVVSLFVTSCSNDDESDQEIQQEATAQITTKTINQSDEVDMVEEELSNIALDVFAADEAAAKGMTDYESDFLPDCVIITTVVTSSSITRTIDFGEGCELPNGNILAGKVIVSYSANFEAPSHTITVALENFLFNEISIEGGKTIVRTFTDEGNPIANKVANFDVVWPDGDTASYSADKTREWIEGFATGTWADNVFLLSGNVNFVNVEGNTFTKDVIVPLRREWACRFIVSGVLEMSRNDITVSLDFGDGSCDPFGELTLPDGTTIDILLRRFL
jgi:outer membrane murein-binding lipoprotein Lpp